jgi:hypothetical protein
MAYRHSQPQSRPPRRGPSLDTSPVIHNLYVLVVDSSDKSEQAQKARQLTLLVLQYINSRLGLFTKMGVNVRVHKVRKVDLGNMRLKAAMKAKGITSLPALITPNNTYVGNKAIGGVYERNIKAFEAYNRRGIEGPTGMAPEDELAKYYGAEMTIDKAKEEDKLGGGEEIGEGKDMMSRYQDMMRHRDQRNKRKPGSQSTARSQSTTGQTARQPPVANRNNNISGGSGDVDKLIEKMAGDIDSQTFEQAFSGHGGDGQVGSTDNNGNAQDDLMEKAYWANQQLSM